LTGKRGEENSHLRSETRTLLIATETKTWKGEQSFKKKKKVGTFTLTFNFGEEKRPAKIGAGRPMKKRKNWKNKRRGGGRGDERGLRFEHDPLERKGRRNQREKSTVAKRKEQDEAAQGGETRVLYNKQTLKEGKWGARRLEIL